MPEARPRLVKKTNSINDDEIGTEIAYAPKKILKIKSNETEIMSRYFINFNFVEYKMVITTYENEKKSNTGFVKNNINFPRRKNTISNNFPVFIEISPEAIGLFLFSGCFLSASISLKSL